MITPDAVIVLANSLQSEVTWINPKNIYIIPNGVKDHYIRGKGKINLQKKSTYTFRWIIIGVEGDFYFIRYSKNFKRIKV